MRLSQDERPGKERAAAQQPQFRLEPTAVYIAICDIRRHDSAHRRQASAQRCIKSAASPLAILSHSVAHASQTAAQTPQVCG